MLVRALRTVLVAASMLCAARGVAQIDSARAAGSGVLVSPPKIDSSQRTALIALNRSVNTYVWTLNSGAAGVAAGQRYAMTERLTASLIPDVNAAAAERTDADVRLGLWSPLNSSWSITGSTGWQTTVDNRNVGINNVSRFGGMGGLEGTVADVLHLVGQAGAIVDRQIGISNAGPEYEADAQLAPLVVNEYTVWGDAGSAQEFIAPRRNTTQSIELNAATAGAGNDVRAHVDYLHTERDFYFADSSGMPFTGHAYNIEQRGETGAHGMLQANYALSDVWRMRFDGDLLGRTVTRHDEYKSFLLPGAFIDTRVKEFRLAGSVALVGELFGAAATANVRYEDYEENHGVLPAPENSAIALQQQALVESQKNSIARRTQLGAGLGMPVGDRDTITTSASFGILHYDTPDTANTDDRDELDMAFHAAYSTHPYFGTTWGVQGDIFLHHLVYLFSAQSGNNAWNRIIRLGPFITIAPSRVFRTFAAFDVLGNYTVFDFESILQAVHSYSYRQLELRDSSEYDLSSTLRVTAFADLRWYEHGQLDYAAFRERPVDRVQEWTYGGTLQSQVWPDVRAGIGMRMFARYVAAYGGGGVYAPTANLRAYGPTVQLTWRAPAYGVLGIDGWYEVIREGTLAARVIPNIIMTVQWNL